MEKHSTVEGQREKATFAMGCFWGPEEFFSQLPGVISTRVGYSGGTKKNPTYTKLGDHTESIEIIFNTGKLSYETLLKFFWDNHDPTTQQKPQYQSIIFYHSAHQKILAEQSKQVEQKRYKKPILTRIEPAAFFYEAEEYHQKYFQKQRR